MTNTGSSPQGRGTHAMRYYPEKVRRFIPAGAGNTQPAPEPGGQQAVHPRRGGEHGAASAGASCCGGSSPQGRGTPDGGYHAGITARFIPAGAGNTKYARPPTMADAVHPRRGGEHDVFHRPVPHGCGSSPQGRGTRSAPVHAGWGCRFIPAGAGNTLPVTICNLILFLLSKTVPT